MRSAPELRIQITSPRVAELFSRFLFRFLGEDGAGGSPHPLIVRSDLTGSDEFKSVLFVDADAANAFYKAWTSTLQGSVGRQGQSSSVAGRRR